MSKEESRKHSIIQDASDQTVLLEVGLHNFIANKAGMKFAESMEGRVTVRPTAFQQANRRSADGAVSLGRQYDFVPGDAMVSGKAVLQIALLECYDFPAAMVSAVASLCNMLATERAESGDEKWTEAMNDLMAQFGMVVDPKASDSARKNLRRWTATTKTSELIVDACEFAHTTTGVAEWPVESEVTVDEEKSESKQKYGRYDCPACVSDTEGTYEGITVRVNVTKQGEAPSELMQKCGAGDSGRSMAVLCPIHETPFKLKAATGGKVAKLEAELAALKASIAENAVKAAA
jgi:hypothetical protein